MERLPLISVDFVSASLFTYSPSQYDTFLQAGSCCVARLYAAVHSSKSSYSFNSSADISLTLECLLIINLTNCQILSYGRVTVNTKHIAKYVFLV